MAGVGVGGDDDATGLPYHAVGGEHIDGGAHLARALVQLAAGIPILQQQVLQVR